MMCLILLLVSAVLPDGYTWHDFKDGSDEYALLRNGEQVGGYNAKTGVYRPRDPRSGRWCDACECPCEPPVKNFGVIASARGDHTFKVNGVEVTEDEAFASLRDEPRPVPPPIPQGMLRVVVIGCDADTARVRNVWDSDNALSAYRDRMVFQCFAPDDWQVAEYGFVTSGKPTIYCLSPDGTVLHRQDDFEGGGPALAEALRSADSAYNGGKDADRRNAMDSVLDAVKKIPPAAALLGAVAVLAGVVLFLRKGK